MNQLLLKGKEWPGGDGKGRLSSEGLASFLGFATSSLEYPWLARFTSVCLSLSKAAGSSPSPSPLILPCVRGVPCTTDLADVTLYRQESICKAQGKMTPLYFVIFHSSQELTAPYAESLEDKELFCIDQYTNLLSVQTLGPVSYCSGCVTSGLKSWK